MSMPVYKMNSSPVLHLLAERIILDREKEEALYLQIARQIILAVKTGSILPQSPLPGTRALAAALRVHRKTIIAAFDELSALGWIEILPNKGTFIAAMIPEVPRAFTSEPNPFPTTANFTFTENRLLEIPTEKAKCKIELTDGMPDIRLAPLSKLAKIYGGILKRRTNLKYFGYTNNEGNEYYRHILAKYLRETRSISPVPAQILTTRGTEMALYLLAQTLVQKEDFVLIGELSYYRTNMAFQQVGAKLQPIPVDENGIDAAAIESFCQKHTVRLLYLTPQHHYPTTVTLSHSRRLEIIHLAEKYGFIILEDDLDYDFHYLKNRLQPIASMCTSGQVIYIGSFDKAIAPGFRAGFLVAPQNIIRELEKLRQIIDWQGDLLMEQAFAELMNEGEIQRHLKKTQKIYLERRNAFCQLLESQLGEKIRFDIPTGGLALWAHLPWNKNLLRMSQQCLKKGLHIPQHLLYQTEKLSAMRIGFGNLNEAEMSEAITILAKEITTA